MYLYWMPFFMLATACSTIYDKGDSGSTSTNLVATTTTGTATTDPAGPSSDTTTLDPEHFAVTTEAEAMSALSTVWDPSQYVPSSAIFGFDYLDNGTEVPTWAVSLLEVDSGALLEALVDAKYGTIFRYIHRTVGTEVLTEELDINLPLAVTAELNFFSQRDSAWSGSLINGNSDFSLGNNGGLISILATSLCLSGPDCQNPDDLNTWSDLTNRFGECTTNDQDELSPVLNPYCVANLSAVRFELIPVSEVWEELVAGHPVIMYGAQSDGSTNCHAQLIWEHDGSRYWSKDPWYTEDYQDQAASVSTFPNSQCDGWIGIIH